MLFTITVENAVL